MSFSSSVNSLSGLVPVKLNYNYNNNEALTFSPKVYSNQLTYYKYSAFTNIQDVALSKQNALFLTETKPLSNVFEQAEKTSLVGDIAGTFFLTTSSVSLTASQYLQHNNGLLYFGPPTYEIVVLSVIPITSDVVELYTKDGIPIVVDAEYPYTVRVSTLPLAPDEQYRKQFVFDYANNTISLKTTTSSGSKFISYGVDGILRAIGAMFNKTIISPYLFTPVFITDSSLIIGFDPTSNEVKYYNDLESFKKRATVDIKTKNVAETNLLISCATSDITKDESTNINIALLRTNFTSTGTYAPLH